MNLLPKVLLLGDSIRMSYQPLVTEMLAGRAEVVAPEENCQFSAHTLASLDRWLSELGTPDIVHWNNGLHDIGHNLQREPVQFPLTAYLANLEAILQRLRATDARIVWATSTPVHPTRAYPDANWFWRQQEIDVYNQAAAAFMQREGIPINDLAVLIRDNPDAYLITDGIHLTESGIRRCAEAVTAAVAALLPERS